MTALPQPETWQELQAALAASRAALLRNVVGVSEEQFRRRPAVPEGSEAGWCIAEVLAHLLDNEKLQGGRIEQALANDGSELIPQPPEERAAAARAGRIAPVPQLIHGLLASRRRIETLLAQAAEQGALGKALRRPEGSSQTIETMARQDVVGHEQEHVLQIEALRQEVGAQAVTEPPNASATR